MAVVIYRPHEMAAIAPVFPQIQGGGYVLGPARMGDIANRALAAALDCIVVAVEYRFPPETAHPGPVEDCAAP
jgi:acetyl esterase/lipase